MITEQELREAQAYAAERLEAAGIALTDAERRSIEVADFGLSRLREIGLQLLVYVNAGRYCAKELVLFRARRARSTATLRSRGRRERRRRSAAARGVVHLHVAGEEIVLRPGEQHTIPPDTLHWFQAGPEGAVVSEFSSTSRDDLDVFTDPAVQRSTVVG